jgi:hypothetical protein
MGAKDSSNAKAAQEGAKNQPSGEIPGKQEPAVMECQEKHWIGVRVEFEDGKLVETGVMKKLKLNNGETRDVSLGPGAQSGGKYDTGKILPSTDECYVSFPDIYDAEIEPK